MVGNVSERASRPSISRFRPALEQLEDRLLLDAGNFTTLPVIPVIDASMKAHLQAVLAQGVQMGNRLDVFSKIGDSITAAPQFLSTMGPLSYDPSDPAIAGAYTDLASTINYFRFQAVDASGSNSFDRVSLAAHAGWTTANVLGDGTSTSPLEMELAAAKPAFALIELGTNDAAYSTTPTVFQDSINQLAQAVLAQGVVPILSTIPDIPIQGGVLEPFVPEYNQAIANVAAALQVPLWNYWAALQSLPNLGISTDGVHPSSAPGGDNLFTPDALLYGFNVRNLTAVEVLAKLQRIVLTNGAPDGSTAEPLSPSITSFMTHLYQVVLGRAPDPAGLEAWGMQMQDGLSAQAVAQAIWESAEHRGDEVDQLYAQLLHHAPDPGGRIYWIDAFNSGATVDDVRFALLTSQEYQQAHATASAFLTGVYQDLLGQSPGATAPSPGALDSPEARASFVSTLIASDGARDHIIEQYYSSLLGHTADPGGESYWLYLWQSGVLTEDALAEGLLGSAEFSNQS